MPIQWTPQAGSSHARHAIAPNRNVQARCRSPPGMAQTSALRGSSRAGSGRPSWTSHRSRVERSQALEVTCTPGAARGTALHLQHRTVFTTGGKTIGRSTVRLSASVNTTSPMGCVSQTGDHDMPLPRNTTSSCRCRSGAPGPPRTCRSTLSRPRKGCATTTTNRRRLVQRCPSRSR